MDTESVGRVLPVDKPVCEGFSWVGQPITSCDDCGHPIWEHDYDKRGLWLKPFSTKEVGAWLEKGRISKERAVQLLSVEGKRVD